MTNSLATDRICIGIPTYRRPAKLAALLTQVLAELPGSEATILVADNEVSPEVEALVGRIARESAIPIHYLPVAERGISQARNALVSGAFVHRPDFDWLVMYDDDAVLRPGALGTLVDCARRHGADLAGGPTIGTFPPGYRNIFVENSVLASRTRWATGPIQRLEITQNIVIAKSLFAKVAAPLFRAEFGLTGGEDYDLFRRAELAGARQVWCDEAVIDEPVVTDRLTTASIMRRAYGAGISIVMVDRHYDSVGSIAWGNFAGLAKSALSVLGLAITGRRDRAARATLGIVYYVGRIAGHAGLRSYLYR